ncbi:hypothetical protein Y1Q_0005404 [Alligator mississippiensis]|uniref:Uncharacterized protein n=1 Tax=Alligator mississippiensis TaxID=8496 RepID=A0A151N0W1_ALLMI|nr:hypothetical protein Y1Q_0005404 [Alligator mississippiensis]
MGRRVTEDYIVEECGYLIEKFESQKGKPFDPIMIMNGAVGNIIVSIVLGERFGYEDPQFVKLLHLINENVRVCGSPSVMEENDTNSYFQDGNLKALITNLFTAGLETTSTTLRWGFLLMMKYPEIQQKVQEEIERVLGSNPPRIEHRSKMPYTDAVVHEIQRFSNILPMDLPHETTMDVTLKGYFIPKE